MAGGFFSGASDLAVSGGVAEAEDFANDAETAAANASDWATGNAAQTIPDNTPAVPTFDNTTPSDTNNARYFAQLAHAYAEDAANETLGDLTDLNDVTITSPTLNQFLRYNGTIWVNEAVTDVVVNDTAITLTAGTGLTGGGDFTTDQASAETITFNVDPSYITTQARASFTAGTDISITNGVIAFTGTPPQHTEHLNISFSPSELTVGDSDTTVTITLASSGGETLSDTSVTVVGPDNTSKSTNGSGTSYTFTADDNDAVGRYRVTANATWTPVGSSQAQPYTNFADLNVVAAPPAAAQYRTATTTTVLASLTDSDFASGVDISSPFNVTYTATNGGSNFAYIALPASDTFTIQTGVLFADTTERANVSLGGTSFDIFRLNDFADGSAGTLTFTITET